jgi:hypothetical protein
VGEAGEGVGRAVAVLVLGFGHLRHLGDADFGRADDVEAAAVVEAAGEELPFEGLRIRGRLGAEDIAAAEDDEQGAIFGEVDRPDFRRGPGGEFDVLDLVAVVEFDGVEGLKRQDAKNAKFDDN